MFRFLLRFGPCAVGLFLWLGAALAQTPNVVIGYENGGADPFAVTKGLGLFQKMMPAKISMKYFDSGPAAMSALASNSLQFMCVIGVPPFVAAISQGVPLGIIFNQERYTTDAGLVARPGSGINSIADLKGRKIAIVVGSQSSFELATFLAQAKVPYDSVQQINMSSAEMPVAWSTKSIDAAIVWDPPFDELRGMGATVLKTDADLPRDASSYDLCVANSHWVRSHAALALDFVRALDAGVTYTKEHREQALKIMTAQAGITLPVAKTELAGYEVFSAKDQLSPNVLGSGDSVAHSATTLTLANTAKVLYTIGRITKPVANPAAFVDSAFAEEVVHGN